MMTPDESRFIAQLFHQYAESLLAYAQVLLTDKTFAEDIVQDTFHEAINQVYVLMTHPNPGGWLICVLRNKIHNHERVRHRALKRMLPLENVTQEDTTESVESYVMKHDGPDLLLLIQNVLGDDDFRFLMRFAMDHASHKEVADEYGVSVWASTKRLSRIRKKLVAELPDYKDFY